jgi:hypothetical protein
MTEGGDHSIWRNVKITYPDRATGKEFVLTGDEATVDRPTHLATLRGRVVLTTPQGQKVTGDELRLNLQTREWSMHGGKTELTPELLQNGVLGSIFANANTITGVPGHYRLQSTDYTTCDLVHPHYFFRARSVDIYPGDKMIVRRATLYVLGHRLFTLPTLVFPLREHAVRRYPITPEVGQNQEEGYYVKSAYQYALKGGDLGLLKLDLLQKRGVGTGVQQAYRLAGGAGTLLLYGLIPIAGVAAERSGHLDHSQHFGSIRADFTGDYRQSDYQYAVANGTSTTTTGTGINLSRQVGGSNTALSLRQDQTTGFGTFSTLSSTLTQIQQFGHGLSGTFGADYVTSNSSGLTGGGLNSSQVNSRMELKDHQRVYDLTLTANDSSNLSGGTGRVSTGLQRQPELSFETATTRLSNNPIGRILPLRFLFSFGRFIEQPRVMQTERALFQLDLTNKQLAAGSQSLDLNDMFRQSFYGDGGAQYVLGGTNKYTLRLGRYASYDLSHIFQRPEGFTPFVFDFPYKQNRVESELLFARGQRFNVGFRTGYDLRAPQGFHWQNLTMRLQWLPTRNTLLYLASSYNPNPLGLPISSSVPQSHLQTVITQLRIRIPNGLKLDLGLRYDPARSRFPAAKFQIDTPIGRQWHFAGLFGYDGFSRFNDFMIIRDLHCWELQLVRTDHRDWRTEQGWSINLMIKAFPVYSNYGLGVSGQQLNTSVGDVF